MSVGMCWLLLLSGYVLIMSGGALGVYMSDVYGYLRCLHVSGGFSAHPLNGGKFILFWHSPERQDFFTWPY